MNRLMKILDGHLERPDSLPWNISVSERILRLVLGGFLFTIPFYMPSYMHACLTWPFVVLSFVGLYLGMSGSFGWDAGHELLFPEARSSRDPRYASLTRQILFGLNPVPPQRYAVHRVKGTAATASPDRRGFDRAA